MTKQSQGLFLLCREYRLSGRIFLYFDHAAGVQITQTVSQGILHHIILGLTGAVAGKVSCRECTELADGLGQFPAIGIHADEMKTTEKDIRTEPVENVQQTFVGTSAEAQLLSALFQKQILFMQIVVIRMGTVLAHGLAKSTKAEGPQQVIAGTQGDTGKQLSDIGNRDQTGIAFQGRIQTDVLPIAEIVTKGIFIQIDRGMIIDLQKSSQAAAVVIMAMRENAKVHLGQIDAQFFCVIGKSTGLTGIKKDIAICSFDVQAQTVFGSKIFAESGIFNQDSYFHRHHLKSGFRCSGRLHAG